MGDTDTDYPGMIWRIHFLDASLSDMANKSRSKDAGLHHALMTLNSTKGSGAEGSPMRPADQGAIEQHPTAQIESYGPPSITMPSSMAA